MGKRIKLFTLALIMALLLMGCGPLKESFQKGFEKGFEKGNTPPEEESNNDVSD